MVLSASQANSLTLSSIQITDEQQLNQELASAEARIRQVAGLGKFKLGYNALILGNPVDDPQDDSNLTDLQIQFRDHFNDQGYIVSLEPETGFWLLDWTEVGAESQVTIYSARTTVAPGPVSQQTIDAINTYFDGVIPAVNSRVEIVDTDPPSGGDIPESDFGAPDSVFFEYIIIAEQQNDFNHKDAIKTALKASGLGYDDDTRITESGGASNTTAPGNEISISDGTTSVTLTLVDTDSSTFVEATEFVTQVNANATLQSIFITADINGPDLIIRNNIGGLLTIANITGDPVGDLFSGQTTGTTVDNVEVYKIA